MKKSVLRPLGCRVVMERDSIRKIGRIIVADNSREMKVALGTVKSIGPDCELVKPGNKVMFGQYAPMQVDVNEFKYYGLPKVDVAKDGELLLLNEEDILCIIDEEGEEDGPECNG